MFPTRREFLSTSAAFAAGFAGLKLASAAPASTAAGGGGTAVEGFGPLVADAKGLLDLPKGFRYQIVSRMGDEMDDGLLLPGRPDGMAAFPGPDGLTIVMRNHELHAHQETAFGPGGERLDRVDLAKFYDRGAPNEEGKTLPGGGGVTALVYDTREQRVVRQFLALAGTTRNCAGGPTPWGSWITCEEATDTPRWTEKSGYACRESHGYAFEAPATAEPTLHQAEPLRAMGRFRREAVAIDPATGAVYQTEDLDDGAFYRFLPNQPGKLAEGGRLQALAIDGQPRVGQEKGVDTRNWGRVAVEPGERLAVRWVDLDNPDSPDDDLRYRAYDQGAARFARGEGIWWTEGGAYFACTSGGRAEIGQLWRYEPTGPNAGSLELFIEPNDSSLIENADNLTAAPWGDLVVCEDRQGEVVRLVGVTPEGRLYTLARNHARCEFAGVTFSPDGSTLLVNLQTPGLTVAITGPWDARA